MSERIAKYIANSGYCSRRKAEELISSDKVKLNGDLVRTPVTFVEDGDEVTVEGKLISSVREKQRIWAFNKPTGCLCTRSDEHGRKTIYDLLPKGKSFQNLHYIGRLDMNSEGLLLLTNSSEVKRFYEHPENKVERVYLVRVYGGVDPKIFTQSEKGFAIYDKKKRKKLTYYAKIEPYKSSSDTSRNSWLKFTLKEGKNREIRNICEKFGLEVSRLKRISFGKFKLDNLPKGQIFEV